METKWLLLPVTGLELTDYSRTNTCRSSDAEAESELDMELKCVLNIRINTRQMMHSLHKDIAAMQGNVERVIPSGFDSSVHLLLVIML